MDRVRFGHASVARVLELRFDLGIRFFPQTPESGWRDNADLLVPDFFNPDTDQWHIAIQSWVIEVDGLTVIVDTGAGNDRQRPHMPPLDHLNTAFLAALRSAGIDRNTVDVVVNTHIHSDHVGWNTMLENGTWVPTFPNARYVAPAADYHFFQPDGPAARQSPRTEEEAAQQRGNQLVFADSVLPVDEAGQLIQWSDDYQISQSLRLRSAPGTHPAPRCCGWMRVSVRCSSAISPTARCNCSAPATRAHLTWMPPRPRPPAGGYSLRPRRRQGP
jgi:glyoxylase-like metal-dependent hydrolase (beta-lactamase superfamily II)